MGWVIRAGVVVVGGLALLGTGCAGPRAAWMSDESDRIAKGMTPETFSEATPGAQGIRLGDDAPPLAEPFQERDPWIYPGLGRTVVPLGGCCQGHGLRPRFIYKGSSLLP